MSTPPETFEQTQRVGPLGVPGPTSALPLLPVVSLPAASKAAAHDPLAPVDESIWEGSLVDTFGRVHTDLRVSVTDRCNIRCVYCMPAEAVQFKPKHELLTFEEIERLVRVAARLGVNKLRLTGGEPLVRRELPKLVARLSRISGIRDIALTTNGMLLAEQAAPLRRAGLHRLNISLDALDAETFQRIARREGLEQVLAGIAAAKRAGFGRIRLNAVALRGVTESQIVPLVTFAREQGLEMRFIEYMPLDADHGWDNAQVLSGQEIRAIIEREIGRLEPLPVTAPHQPATDYRFVDGCGTLGFINPVTQPFCSACNRLRLTAEGQLRNCLFSLEEWDARHVIRAGGSDAQLARLLRDCVAQKRAGHGINSDEFRRPERSMYEIGG
ncbi:MAG: GTP 3',8-cyclase MoaA [Planctomycetes bacterium]|nr:GTP 3',8-cyclase MoaA [Planctomycetota bacterium]